MARIPLEHTRTPFVRFLEAYSRRTYGKVLEPALVMLHHRKVLKAVMKLEKGAQKWDTLPETLQALAVTGAAAELNCSWCMDFGYFEYHHRGVDPAKLRSLPQWETSPAYTDLERRVIGYAVAMSRTPVEVTDEMVAALREDLTDEQVVELTSWVALENQRSRVNMAMGLTSQGFKESCEVPRQEATAR